MQLSTALRNARGDVVESTIGPSAVLKFFTGALPANCGSPNQGTELVSIALASDWMSAAVNGVKSLVGSAQAAAIAAGNIGHYRLYASNGTTCHMQGTVTITGGAGDMEVDNINVAIGQLVTVTTMQWTEPGA